MVCPGCECPDYCLRFGCPDPYRPKPMRWRYMALVVLGLTFAGWANWANGEVRTRSEETSYANLV
jgi:hypothetical protein